MKRLLGLWLLSACAAFAVLTGCAGKQPPTAPEPPPPVRTEPMHTSSVSSGCSRRSSIWMS